MTSLRRFFLVVFAVVALLAPTFAHAQGGGACCILPDNGAGSASLPPNCAVGYTGPSAIIDGLPVGSPVQMAARLHSFTSVVESAGGSLGGEQSSWAATLDLNLTGTGVYLGYNRFIAIPVVGITHSAPRVPFAPVQAFAMDLFQMQGQITGDPDFDLLRITGGTNFGLPSPGQTVLTSNGGGWEVSSYIDISHRVDFVGRPGGTFSGRSGSTMHTLPRFEMCYQRPTPAAPGTWGRLKATYR
jgi:hypothetical protein